MTLYIHLALSIGICELINKTLYEKLKCRTWRFTRFGLGKVQVDVNLMPSKQIKIQYRSIKNRVFLMVKCYTVLN